MFTEVVSRSISKVYTWNIESYKYRSNIESLNCYNCYQVCIILTCSAEPPHKMHVNLGASHTVVTRLVNHEE